MPLYIFHLCQPDGGSPSFEAHEADHDSATFPLAGQLLDQHPGCAYVAVWQGERPVLSRHREAPHIRPVGQVETYLRDTA